MGRKGEYVLGFPLNLDEDGEHEFKSVVHAIDPASAISKHARRYVNAFLNTNGGVCKTYTLSKRVIPVV